MATQNRNANVHTEWTISATAELAAMRFVLTKMAVAMVQQGILVPDDTARAFTVLDEEFDRLLRATGFTHEGHIRLLRDRFYDCMLVVNDSIHDHISST